MTHEIISPHVPATEQQTMTDGHGSTLTFGPGGHGHGINTILSLQEAKERFGHPEAPATVDVVLPSADIRQSIGHAAAEKSALITTQ